MKCRKEVKNMNNDMQPHIRCTSKDAAKYAILPGDPKRVEEVKKFLDNPVDIAYNREFKSCTGYYKGIKIMVISTGIGGVSTGIVVEELRNIGVQTLIRIGSCGALQKNIKLGDIIIGNGVVRDDGTSKTYIDDVFPAIPDIEVLISLLESAKEADINYHCGMIRSHDSFYTDKEEEIDNYWAKNGVLGSDMESAALFVIGTLRKLKTASVLNVVVESDGKLDDGINSYVEGEGVTVLGEKREIKIVLDAIIKLENKLK